MMKDYAVVSGGIVVNLVVWDGEAKFDPGSGGEIVAIPDGTFVDIGSKYDGGTFSAPD